MSGVILRIPNRLNKMFANQPNRLETVDITEGVGALDYGACGWIFRARAAGKRARRIRFNSVTENIHAVGCHHLRRQAAQSQRINDAQAGLDGAIRYSGLGSQLEKIENSYNFV